jgi:hypothetical protein
LKNESKTIHLDLFGQKLVLKARLEDGEAGAKTDPALVRQAADLVTAKVLEAQKRAAGAAPHQVALIALMDLAVEYLSAKERTEEYMKQVADTSGRVLQAMNPKGQA